LAGDGFDHELGEVDAFAGVCVARAGVEVDVELAVVFKGAPVGEAGGVAEEDAQGELLPAGVALEVGVAGVLGERLGQVLEMGLSRSSVLSWTRLMTRTAKVALLSEAEVMTESGVRGRLCSVSRRP
jgi:hypothetical protein